MLTQFRIRYPQGSLISELLTIDHGKYIVRVLVQSHNVTIATGLAAAYTIEEAEDNARNRALSILDLDAATVAPQSATPNTKVSEIEEEKKLKSHKQKSAKPTQSDRLNLSLSQESSEPSQLEPLLSGKTTTPNHKDNISVKPEIFIKEVTSPITALASEIEVIDEPLPLVLQETSSDPEITLSSEDTISIQPSTEDDVTEESSFEEPLENNLSEQSSVQESLTPKATEPIDFSDVIAKSNFELKRLGWTNDQGRNYLLQTYGKRSRQLLSDGELLEFLHYLEAQATP